MSEPFPHDAQSSAEQFDAPAPESKPEPKKAEPKPKTTRRKPAARARVNVRAVAEKAEQFFATSESDRDFLAAILAAPSAEPVELTVAVMESKKNPLTEVIDDLRVVQESEVPTATIHLVGMTRAAHDALIALLRQTGVEGLPEKAPAKATDAALALIGPVRDASVDLAELDRLSELLDR